MLRCECDLDPHRYCDLASAEIGAASGNLNAPLCAEHRPWTSLSEPIRTDAHTVPWHAPFGAPAEALPSCVADLRRNGRRFSDAIGLLASAVPPRIRAVGDA